jgi:hypothetical protein
VAATQLKGRHTLGAALQGAVAEGQAAALRELEAVSVFVG